MHYIIELFVILTLLIIPPFFSNQVPKLTIPTFSWKDILIFGTIALYCFIRVKDEKTKDYPINYFKPNSIKNNISKKSIYLKTLLLSFISLGFLFLNGCFWQWISKAPVEKTFFSNSTLWYIFQIFGILGYAFYEEAMYRYFLPFSIGKNLSIISKSENPPKWIFTLSEIIALLLFSFGHLYMGIFAVLNGFFAGIALRFLVLKTKSVFPSTIIHFIYNLVLYLSMFTKA